MSDADFQHRMSDEMSAAKRMGNTELANLIREVILEALRNGSNN